MKLNISFPATGCQKLIEIEDENKLRAFYDKRISREVEGDILGDEFKGYVFRISGGNDKQGFPMKQGVMTTQRVRLLLKKGHSCFRERRAGERKRKSVRGCIVSSDLSVLNLVIVVKGEGEIPGLTDTTNPRRLGPKRASKIKRLVTPQRLQHRRQIRADKRSRYTKSRADAEVYNALVTKRFKEAKDVRNAGRVKRRSESRKMSTKSDGEPA